MKRIGSIISVIMVATAAWCQETMWTYTPPAGHIDVAPGIGDINGDGRVEIVVGTTAGLAIALNGKGQELWRRETGAAVCIPPTVADVTGDSSPEVLIMNRRGRVLCLVGETGGIIWDTVIPAPPEWGMTTLAVGDLEGDGVRDIVTGTRDGSVVCLRGTSGEQVWFYQGGLDKVFCPAIADLDGDGQAEVVVGSERVSLVCLGASGKELWRLDQGRGASPFVCDLPGIGSPVIITGVDKTLQALDATGNSLWSCPMQRELDSAITIADADEDGEVEIYAVDLAGYFVCVSPKGEVKWKADVEQRVRRSPSVGDVDGDGVMEILIAGYSGAIHVFEPQGRLKARVPLPQGSNSTATLAALGDGGLCAIIPMAGQPLHVLRWPGATQDAKVVWPEFRHDSRRTGSILAGADVSSVELAVDFGAMYVGSNCLTATVRNPDHRRLTLHVEAIRNHGASTTDEMASAEAIIEHRFPYALRADESTDLNLVCTVLEGDRVIARRARTARIEPFTKEASDAEKMLAAVRQRLPRLIDPAGIEERTLFASLKLDSLQTRMASAGSAVDTDRAALRDSLAAILLEAGKLAELSAMAECANSEGSTSVIRAANPWGPFGGIGDLARNRDAPKELTVFAFAGERESTALNIFNLSSQPRSYRLELDGLSQEGQSLPAKEAVTLLEVIEVPTERCDMSADALAAINAANILLVPAWNARQLWLNVDARALAPGVWQGSLLIRSLDVTPTEVRVPLTITVWNAQLPSGHRLRHCGWGYVESSMLKDQPDAALNDQVEHGTNVFVASVAPRAKFDAEGNLQGDMDFTEHDAYVKRHAPHGILLFCGYQGAVAGPGDASSEAYRKAHIQWLRQWVRHLTDVGVGYDGFALYPVDEPGLHPGLVDAYLQMAKLAREADPKIQMYTDPVAGITEDELRSMLPYVDIWCPNRGGLILDKANAGKLAIIKGSGKAVWTYECDDNAKHLSPLGYYRGQSWLAWQHGLTGIGFWTYCTSQDDPWFVPRARYDYLLVYPGNGIVTSKRWEAVRDGIEDYAMLALLRQTIADKASSARPEDLEAARSLLGEKAATVAGFCVVDDDNATLMSTDERAIRSRLEDRQWAELQEVRHKLARLLDSL